MVLKKHKSIDTFDDLVRTQVGLQFLKTTSELWKASDTVLF